MRTSLHNVAIVGVYNTKQARVLEGATTRGLVTEALFGAVADAGLMMSDIDGLSSSTFPGADSITTRDMILYLGGQRRPMWYAEGSGIVAVAAAAAAIGAGLCETVALYTGQAGTYSDRSATAPWTRPSHEFAECWGLHTPAQWGLVARRHMHLYGTKQEALAEVASAIRMNGARNPNAAYHGRAATPEDVLASRMVCDPYHLLDCCTTTEGGAALVMTTVERARDMNVTPVYILGAGVETPGTYYKTPMIWDRVRVFMRETSARAFAMAGLRPEDIDVCEWYDNFSWEIIRKFEAAGFCDEGEGGDFVMGGRIRIDGELPICTDGGLMSYSHAGNAQVLQRVIEGVLQIQGRAANQVPGAKYVIADNFMHDVLILGPEPVS